MLRFPTSRTSLVTLYWRIVSSKKEKTERRQKTASLNGSHFIEQKLNTSCLAGKLYDIKISHAWRHTVRHYISVSVHSIFNGDCINFSDAARSIQLLKSTLDRSTRWRKVGRPCGQLCRETKPRLKLKVHNNKLGTLLIACKLHKQREGPSSIDQRPAWPTQGCLSSDMWATIYNKQ